MNRIFKISGIIAAILLIAFCSAMGKFFGKSTVDNHYSEKQNLVINEKLLNAANEINSKLPIMVDSETRLSSTIGFNKTFRYNYTLINYLSSDISANELEGNLSQKLKNSVCTSKEMQVFIKAGVAIEYAYFGNDGKQITVITIYPSNCTNITNG